MLGSRRHQEQVRRSDQTPKPSAEEHQPISPSIQLPLGMNRALFIIMSVWLWVWFRAIAIHQVAIGADLCHVLEDLEGPHQAGEPGVWEAIAFMLSMPVARSECRPQHAQR